MTDTPTPRMGLVLDCTDPERLAVFWAPALGYLNVGMVGSYALLLPTGSPAPSSSSSGVPEPKSAKNRMHLDIETLDIEAEAARLEALGATRVQADHIHEHGTTWILMTNPEGNELCVCDNGAGADSRRCVPHRTGRRPCRPGHVQDDPCGTHRPDGDGRKSTCELR